MWKGNPMRLKGKGQGPLHEHLAAAPDRQSLRRLPRSISALAQLLLVLKQLRGHDNIVASSFKQERSLLCVAAGHGHEGTHQERLLLVE